MVSVNIETLHARISAPVVHALKQLSSVFSGGWGDAAHPRTPATETEKSDGSPRWNPELVLDDLRSGVFSVTKEEQKPLGVVLSPSHGNISGEDSITWCYPWPRPVTCLFFKVGR